MTRSCALAQFLYRPARTLGVIGAVSLGAALFVALTALGNGFRRAAEAPLADVAADLLVTRPLADETAAAQTTRGIRLPFGSGLFRPDEAAQIQSVDGVADLAAVLEIWDFGASRYQVIQGLPPDQNHIGPGYALQSELVAGRIFREDETAAAVADRHYAALLGLKPGSEVGIGSSRFQIVGIVDQQGKNQAAAANLYIPLIEAQRLVNIKSQQVNQLYIRVNNASRIDAIAAELTEQLGTISVISQNSILQVMGGMARISAKFSHLAGWVGMIGGSLLAWTALAGLLAERRRDIGIMKATGWTGRDIIRVFMAEFFLMGLIGASLGLVLGLFWADLLGNLPVPNTSVTETLPGLTFEADALIETLPTTVPPGTLLLSLCVAVFNVLLTGWFSLRQAVRMNLIDMK